MAGIELDDATIAAVDAALGSAPRPIELDAARIDRQIRELALEHAAGRLEDAVYRAWLPHSSHGDGRSLWCRPSANVPRSKARGGGSGRLDGFAAACFFDFKTDASGMHDDEQRSSR